MAIRFEAPGPIGSGQGGQADAILRSLGPMQQAVEAAMRARQASAENATRASIAQAQMETGAAQQNADRITRADMFMAQQAQEADIANQRAQMHEAELQQRMQMFALAPTQKEMIRVAELRGSMSTLKEQHDNGDITDETFEEARANIWNALGPLQRKMAEAQIMERQARAKNFEEDNRMAQAAAEYRARTLPQRLTTVNVPGIGETTFYESQPGKWEVVPRDKAGDQQQQFKERMMGALRDDWFNAYTKAADYADKRIAAEIKADRDPEDPSAKGRSSWEDPQMKAGARNIYIQEYMQGAGYAPTWEGTLAKMQQQGAQPGPGPIPANGHQPISRADAPVPGMERPPAQAAPFKFDDEQSQNPAQREAKTQWEGLWHSVGALQLPPPVQEQAQIRWTVVKNLLEKYGSVEAMPEKERAIYMESRDAFRAILKGGMRGSPLPTVAPEPRGFYQRGMR